MSSRVVAEVTCSRRAFLIAFTCGNEILFHYSWAHANDVVSLPPFEDVEQVVDRYYVSQKDFRPTDLISQRDAQAIFDQLKRIGWDVADQKQITSQVLPDNHFLIQLLRSPAGKKFMRKTSSFGLIYDRLDRVSMQPGGRQLITDLIKLPNSEQFAKQKTTQGDPDLVALLPKDILGNNQQIANYSKPTGKIYTQSDLLDRLKTSHKLALEKANNPTKNRLSGSR